MGQTATREYVQQQYEIVKPREDGSALLRHRKTKDEFLLRNVCSNMGDEISTYEQILKKRQNTKSPHLLQLIQIRRKEEKNVCSVVHKIYLLIEYPFKTLQDEINEKIGTGRVRPFLQAELWSILYSSCIALNTLYSKKMSHQSLTASDIFISRDGFIKVADPLLLGLEKNYIKVLKKDYHNVHLSPQIINFLDDCNFSFYDKEKSDIFILGAIMLEAALMNSIDLYEKQTKRPMLDIIPRALKELRQKYSNTFVEILEKMLNLHSKFRPKFTQIIAIIEEDTSLYEDTQTTDGQQLSIMRQSFKNLKTQKTQKNQPKQHAIPLNSLHRNSSYSNLTLQTKSVAPRNTAIHPNVNLNFMKKKQDQTITKMHQTEELKLSKTLPSNFVPHSHNQQYYNNSSPKPSGFEVSLPSPIHRNQQQPHFQHSRGPSNFLSYESFPNIPSQSSYIHSFTPLANNNMPPSSRFSDAQNERFSNMKFQNITVDFKKVNNKPIYSHQIPQINEILQKQSLYQPTRSNSALQPNFTSQQTNILQTDLLQPISNLNDSSLQYCQYTQKKDKSYSTFSQNNPPQIYINTPKIQKEEKQIQYFTKSNANGSQNKRSLAINPHNQISQLTNEKKRTIPELNFKDDQVKNTQNNANLELKQIRPSHSIEKIKSHNHNVSLSNHIKEAEEKRIIFAVTQKSEEYDLANSMKNNSNLAAKINEQKRSPPPKQIFLNNIGSSGKKSPSIHKKSLSMNKNQNEIQFVNIKIEGGGTYEGYVKNGLKNGQGKLQFNDGGYYIGEWKDNKMHGFGKLHYENGQVAYQGYWQNDQFCGEGRVFNDRPERLLGPFNYHDFADLGGKWIYYQGEFKSDSKHGKGKIRLTNGEVFQGNFVFDSIEGEGIFYTYQGQAIHGFWSDNVLVEQ